MRTTIILSFMFATTTSLFAQSLTEKIDVSLVNVDVTVTSHGAPARGLTREDFQVFEDGVARPITNFYAVVPPPAHGVAAPAPTTNSDTVVIADPADERFRRKVLVIVDNRHVSMHNRDRALAGLERFVDDRFTGGTYDWSIALISDTMHTMLPLTSDKQKLHEAVAAIRRLVVNPDRPADEDVARIATVSDFDGAPSAESGTFRASSLQDLTHEGTQFQMEADAARTSHAVRDAIRSFAGAPGRKIILLVTGSLGVDDMASPLDASPTSFRAGNSSVADMARAANIMRDALIHEANASNVSFYIINSEGLSGVGGDASVPGHENGRADSVGRELDAGSSNPLTSMYWLARETGGRLLPGNSPESSLAEFDRTSSTFYSLAYKPAHGEDGKYHTIKVRVNHSGYQLQYRTGYSSVPVSVQLARAMQSPMAATMQQSSIPIDIVTGNSAPQGNGGVVVPFHATVPAKNLQFIPTDKGSVARVDLYVSLFDDHGRRVSGSHFTREAHAENGTETNGNFVETHELLLKRGVPYRVVVAVHDEVTDAIGIATKMVRF
jgi:VWFA-related protein